MQVTLASLGVAREKKDVAFVLATGRQITRSVGYAVVHVGEHVTIDEVVFAEPGDLELLGARTLEGLDLTIDPARRRLVAAGPLPAAKRGPDPRAGRPAGRSVVDQGGGPPRFALLPESPRKGGIAHGGRLGAVKCLAPRPVIELHRKRPAAAPLTRSEPGTPC